MFFPPLSLISDAGLLVSELALVWRRRASRAASTRLDRGSHLLLWAVIVGSIIAGNFAAFNNVGLRLLPGLPWRWFGAGLFAAGTALRWWAIVHLGRFFSVDVAIACDHQVVDAGPYRVVRHPSYTGLLLQCAGLGVVLGTTLSLFVIVVPTFLVLFHRIRVEERALLANFGNAYAAYTRSTKRLLPGVF
jgi:protein-S-isoprenylcysteine O-methyltransferase Ste14